MRYARFMEMHTVPVNFRNPSFNNFIRHMDYREEIEGATPSALNHEWKTMQTFLKAYGIRLDDWPYKPPPQGIKRQRILPYPDRVREFFKYKYSEDRYENALYHYIFNFSFMIGWRVPSEICTMTVSDVFFECKGRVTITITEPKKRNSRRTIIPEYFILDSESHKSLKNWIGKWRSKLENQYSNDALFLYKDGRPVTKRHIGHQLSKYGKLIWPHFKPYDTRHWCAIARFIDSKIKTGYYDVDEVRNWLGHEKFSSTQNYIKDAQMYFKNFSKSWIQNALRSRKNEGGKHKGLVCKPSTRNSAFRATLIQIPSRSTSGPAQI